MLPRALVKDFDARRLKRLLALLFLALAIPTAVLIWQAYTQLKWEAFHQHRGIAEELTARIDTSLAAMVDVAEARSFADYSFLVVTGDPSANFVQRSPLSEFPVRADLPGVIGYFQVGTDGAFSTPLLPQSYADPADFGIGEAEYVQRIELAQRLQTILRDNRLVRHTPEGLVRGVATLAGAPASVPEESEESTGRLGERQRESAVATLGSEDLSESDQAASMQALPEQRPAERDEAYSQTVFDALNEPRRNASDAAGTAGVVVGDAQNSTLESKERSSPFGKVADLKLDSVYQKKSEAEERDDAFRDESRVDAPERAKRREQIALPESESVAISRPAGQPPITLPGSKDVRISTFESEVDPLEFSLLDSGHFVLFRKVWRDGQRYIQGLLIDRPAFIRDAVERRFRETGLSATSNLIVAYQDDVLETLHGDRYSEFANSSQAFDGELLYRGRMSSPFDSLELIFGINGLPPGPGAPVLGWVTVVLAVVFSGAFVTLYRLGLSQIALARQQQDFVSAVSHELKTPLTSIRMYGEMLKEGWADPDKRQQYYEFIHDESERLTRLISNVLQLARITRNEPQFDFKAVTVAELLNKIESKISSQVQRAGFQLALDREQRAEQAIINIDDDCFAQIVINLVDNAIKFSKDAEQKRIEIGCKLTSDEKVTFAVRDFGPGIPKDRMKKIFKLFYRLENELTRETVGTGIGLAIVHQLTVAMGGTVDVINREPGAEFSITLPLASR